ncbi:MAG: type 4a pilus biogenesis protein PilO [Candidatus Moranbacteria bacterium]|nr:type 4a pilus biogenesis protein PilO [Candidatus Moranbacteria bacterium]
MKIEAGIKKSLLIFFSFLVSCVLLISFLVIPMVKKTYEQKDLLEEAKLTLKRDQKNIEKYKQDLKYLNQNFFLSEGLVINEDNRVKLIENLEKIAVDENLGMEIEMYSSSVVNQKKKGEEDKTDKTLLKLSLIGEYKDFLVFLYKLQNFKYVVNVDKLTIENFDKSRIKNMKEGSSLENLPEIEGNIIVSFN